ncbi:MAG: D-sedoheptulose 7-phosphate isomerase [Planctomycetota bacterium]|jgi:D-sedoheptulose 7-phosphate isomerase|nr:D-sedoheptulose 7-phosphate isomerase [Planctomycetota bacterium]
MIAELDHLKRRLLESARVMERVAEEQAETILQVGELISEAVLGGKCLYFFGNGGSAADCQHLAAEFVGRFVLEKRALSAIALTTDTSALTAIANDYGYEHVFERQVEALVREGDIAIGISTSGGSANVVLGLQAARKLGAIAVAMTGGKPGKCGEVAEKVISVPSEVTARVQEAHITIGHLFCEMVDDRWQSRASRSGGGS